MPSLSETGISWCGWVSSTRELERCRERMAIYHYHALAIQGAFRGYQSRKYNYNHARRKGYLQEVWKLSHAATESPRCPRPSVLAEGEIDTTHYVVIVVARASCFTAYAHGLVLLRFQQNCKGGGGRCGVLAGL